MKTGWALRCGRVALFVGMLTLPVWADGSDLKGVIKDSVGQPVSGVTVQLYDQSGTLVGNTTTDAGGSFKLPGTADGTYSFKLVKEGFKDSTETVVFPVDARSLLFTLGTDEELVVHVKASEASGPGVSPSGALDYSQTDKDIKNLPAGENSKMADVLVQMPGIALDQNQQIHIRDQHNDGQYQLNGFMLPLDMYAEPAFISFINPFFVKQVDLLTGVLPAQYGFTNSGGVLSIDTKDGSVPGGSISTYFGQRGTFQPAIQYGGSSGKFSYYVNGIYDASDTAFSSATPTSNAIHDETNNEQGFGLFSYKLNDQLKVGLMTSITSSTNQLPNSPNQPALYTLAGVSPSQLPSSNINSYINFHDYMGMLTLNGTPSDDLKWQFAYTIHSLRQDYLPDQAGELIYQGVAATTVDTNHDQSLQGGLTYKFTDNTLKAGFYYGIYDIFTSDTSKQFPVSPNGTQIGSNPNTIVNDFQTHDIVQGYYVNDLWQFSPKVAVNLGLRDDVMSGFTGVDQIDPTVNFIFTPDVDTTVHAGFARYMDTPAFEAFSPLAQASYNGTTNAAVPGRVNPYAQDDLVWDAGALEVVNRHLTLGVDAYYELNHHYGDEGQFGVVPIFVNLNYDHGTTYGGEVSLKYKNETPEGTFSAYTNLTFGQSRQFGVDAGQYNFSAAELNFINTKGFLLDHQPFATVVGGVAYNVKPWSFSAQMLFNTGLRGGFGDTQELPNVFQVDLGVSRSFGEWTDRLTLLNIFDKVNLIRPANGVGVYQAAYGPRFTIFDTITIPLHP
jgi:hypothetical protein